MVLDAIRTKRAIREFTDEPVPEDVIHTIVNAGRRAQSSWNSQPWHFVVIRDRDTLKQLSECGAYAGHLAGAAFAVALIINGKEHVQFFDLGQAAAYMQLAAWELNVGSCIASLSELEQAKTILGIPDDLYFDTALSFGYMPQARQNAAPKAGGRRTLDEVIHWEKW